MRRIERKSDKFQFIGPFSNTTAPDVSPFNNNVRGLDIKCLGCKERNYLFPLPDQPDVLICNNCGERRSLIIEHPTDKDIITTLGNELQQPRGQMVYQSENLVSGRDRRPNSIVRRGPNAAEDYVKAHSTWQVLDSDVEDRTENL
jgi:hypothetical protein